MNRTNASTSPETKVTIHSPQNRYVYTWWRLVLPYMAGLALSLLATLIGGWALFANGVSYAQNFSTIMRTTRNADLQGATLSASDTMGTDPLHEHVAEAKIDFRRQGEAIGLKERRVGGDVGYE
jgi:hypothetical protein